jgi:nucleoside triphosphate diphosphatase
MQDKSALERAMATVRDLRKRCAWDRAQTRETLRPYLVEEVLELDHALAEGEVEQIRAEVSDLLLHLAFQLVIAEERNEFTAGQVADQLEGKMRRRHPHLFDLGDAQPWEHIKRRERQSGVLAGLLPTLPPLLMATRLQERAASVGFDWPNVEGPMAKIREELDEVERELAPQARSGPAKHTVNPNSPGGIPTEELVNEIGDLLFAVVNLARKAGVQAGPALDRANRKFRERFEQIEQLADDRGIELETAGLEVLDGLWDEAKAAGRRGGGAATSVTSKES